MPARKAPSASDSPAACVAHAEESTASSTASENSSLERTPAMSTNNGRSNQRPVASTSSSAAAAIAIAAAMCGRRRVRAGCGKRRQQAEKQGEAQVLEQADRHRDPAMRARVLGLLGELSDDDGGRGHRDGAPDHDRGGRRDPEEPRRRERDQRGGHEHLRAPHAEHLAAHGEQARQRKFQAEREHQERHADIGKQARRVVVDDQGERVRAEQHAHREVTQDRRQGELAHAGHDEYRGGQQDQNLQQRIGVHSRSI